MIRASVDSFHRPIAERYARGADSAEGYFLDSFDYVALKSVLLEPLGPDGDRRFRPAVFDYRTDQAVAPPVQTADVNAILLFDGVFLQCPQLARAWDFRIWVDVPFDITVPRAVRRSPSDDGSLLRTKYRLRYVPGQMLYLSQCRPRESANVIVK